MSAVSALVMAVGFAILWAGAIATGVFMLVETVKDREWGWAVLAVGGLLVLLSLPGMALTASDKRPTPCAVERAP